MRNQCNQLAADNGEIEIGKIQKKNRDDTNMRENNIVIEVGVTLIEVMALMKVEEILEINIVTIISN